MKSIGKVVATVLGLSALVALTVAALLALAVPFDQITLVIDGERVELPEMTPVRWVMLSIGLWVALLVAMAVLPFALVLGLGLPLLVAGLVSALLLSPLLLVGALVWWLWKRGRPASRIAG